MRWPGHYRAPPQRRQAFRARTANLRPPCHRATPPPISHSQPNPLGHDLLLWLIIVPLNCTDFGPGHASLGAVGWPLSAVSCCLLSALAALGVGGRQPASVTASGPSSIRLRPTQLWTRCPVGSAPAAGIITSCRRHDRLRQSVNGRPAPVAFAPVWPVSA